MSRRYPSGSRKALLEIYRRLYGHYGPQQWWPAETPWEVMAGAILTQAATWVNVEKALANLKGAGALAPPGLEGARPSGVGRPHPALGLLPCQSKQAQGPG